MRRQLITLFLEVGDVPFVRGDHENPVRGVAGALVMRSSNSESGCQVLGRILEPYLNDLEIVVTDFGALHAPLETFCRWLPQAVAKRVTSCVYLAELTNSSWSEYHSLLASRYECISLWLARRRPNAGQYWLAFDGGRQLDSWPAAAQSNLVHGSLAEMNVRLQLTKLLEELCQALRAC